MNFRKGFTLIEIMVVVTLIGLFAAIVLASLQLARGSGVEARIKGEMGTLAKRAAIDESKGLTYNVACDEAIQTPAIKKVIASIEEITRETVVCNSDEQAFAASVLLDDGNYWCVDSTGASRKVATGLEAESGIYVCPE